MKHEHEHEHENETPMESEAIDQAQHERLCAYVFDELQGTERAAFEAELLRSPALQRERERLVATVGLVKAAVPDEGLSAAVRRDLVASARRSRFRFLRGRTLVRVAAAAVLLLGGALGVRLFTARVDPAGRLATRDIAVARAPEQQGSYERAANGPREKRREAAAADGLQALRGLGYVGDDAPAAAPETAAPAPAIAQELRTLGYVGENASAPALDRRTSASAPAGPMSPGVHLSALKSAQAGKIDLGAARMHDSLSLQTNVWKDTWRTPGAGGAAGRENAGTRLSIQQLAPLAGGRTTGGGSAGWPAESVTVDSRAAQAMGLLNSMPVQGSRDGVADKVSVLQDLAYAGEQDAEVVELEALGYGGGGASGEEHANQEGARQSRREPMFTREEVAAQVEQLLDATRVVPGESASDMFFRYWGDAPFLPAAEQPSSTFAVDVDTASYALARAYLSRGQLPPREAVRTEEFVNYFKADQPAPADGKPFAIGLELAPSPFAKDARTELLRVSMRGKDVQDFERQPVNLTFVIDNSGSMREGDRLELVKRALALLLRQLRSSDSVAVVKFSNEAAVVTSMLPASRRGELEAAIQALPIEGGTNVEAGLRKGYELALASLAPSAVNRVILCSDGVGNIGETSAKGLLELVKDAYKKGIYLNTVGVGMGNHNDAFLEELADKGDGVCNYVDSDAEAKRVFVDGLASLVQPIARDVKIQVEFDPAQVESWRLLGYENRALREQDFRNDTIDAGEVNAGHQVTALYELVRRPSRSGPLATVHLRYKPPFAIDQGKEGEHARAAAEQALEQERTLQASAVLPGFASATNGYQRAVLVAQFAETLRQSVHARGDAFADLLRESRRLEKALGDPDFTEFVALLEKANPLLDVRSKEETPHVQQLLDELSKLHYEQALRERKRELAAAAGEPESSPDEKKADERVELEAREAIQRLEEEVRAEIERASGLDPDTRRQLDELGYGGDDR